MICALSVLGATCHDCVLLTLHVLRSCLIIFESGQVRNPDVFGPAIVFMGITSGFSGGI